MERLAMMVIRGWSHKFMKSHDLCTVTTKQIHVVDETVCS